MTREMSGQEGIPLNRRVADSIALRLADAATTLMKTLPNRQSSVARVIEMMDVLLEAAGRDIPCREAAAMCETIRTDAVEPLKEVGRADADRQANQLNEDYDFLAELTNQHC